MRRATVLGFFTVFAGALPGGGVGCARKASAVTCTVTYGGSQRRFEVPATSDPYSVKAFDVAGRFSFKATYIREPWRAASVNIYAYQQVDGGNVLLQEGKYTPPFAPKPGTRYGFTGRQLVYSPSERELEYWCEVSP